MQDTPLISVCDPDKVKDWEWLTGLEMYALHSGILHTQCLHHLTTHSLTLLHRSPKHDLADLKAASKAAKDPFELVEKDVSTLSGGVKDLLGSDHPVLESCAK